MQCSIRLLLQTNSVRTNLKILDWKSTFLIPLFCTDILHYLQVWNSTILEKSTWPHSTWLKSTQGVSKLTGMTLHKNKSVWRNKCVTSDIENGKVELITKSVLCRDMATSWQINIKSSIQEADKRVSPPHKVKWVGLGGDMKSKNWLC